MEGDPSLTGSGFNATQILRPQVLQAWPTPEADSCGKKASPRFCLGHPDECIRLCVGDMPAC